jgi:hypothetical protein
MTLLRFSLRSAQSRSPWSPEAFRSGFALWLTMVGIISVPLVLLSFLSTTFCGHESFAPLRHVASVRVVNESDSAELNVRDPERVRAMSAFINARSTRWNLPWFEFSTQIQMTFFDDRRNVLADVQFSRGGMIRRSNLHDHFSVFLGERDFEEDAIALCRLFGVQGALEMCGSEAGLFERTSFDYPVNDKLAAACARQTRSVDVNVDACAKLVFGPGHFQRPVVKFWRSRGLVTGPNTYLARLPGFQLENFCGSLERNADGSVRLLQERNLRRCHFCACQLRQIGGAAKHAVPARGVRYSVTVEDDRSASSIEVPQGDYVAPALLASPDD